MAVTSQKENVKFEIKIIRNSQHSTQTHKRGPVSKYTTLILT